MGERPPISFLSIWIDSKPIALLVTYVIRVKLFIEFKLYSQYSFVLLVPISGFYRIDTEPLFNTFVYSLVLLLSHIYPLPAMHSLLVTLYVTECCCF